MRVLVCGGRKYHDLTRVYEVLDGLMAEFGTIEIIEGDAHGADAYAKHYAIAMKLKLYTFTPQWEKYGKAAGFLRNAEMLRLGKPDLVIAFPGGIGTAMMVDIAMKAAVPVRKIDW